MWEAFGGYGAVYGKLPPARKVRRVTLYLMARNKYEREQVEEQRAEAARGRAGARVPTPSGGEYRTGTGGG